MISRLSEWLRRLPRGAGLAFFIGGALVFVCARLPAGFWTMDDAAITYVYARNAAAGHGVVINPGAMPTEGFSNPLLFLLSLVLSAVGLLHPLRTHLAIEALQFGALAALAYGVLVRAAGNDRMRAVVATVLFLGYELLTPATLIWYGSGLENLQLTIGIVALLARFQRWWSEGPSPWLDGLLALGVALVRPESFLYPVALLVVVLAIRLYLGRGGTPHGFDRMMGKTVGIAVVGGVLFLGLRYAYFGDLLPNTYYAKLGAQVGTSAVAGHLRGYVERQMLVSGAALLFVGGTLAAGLVAASARVWLAILACLCAALALPATSGADWMGQHRFATAFFASAHLGYALLLVAPGSGLVRRPLDLASRLAIGLVPILALHGGWDEYRQFIAPRHATFDVAIDNAGFERREVQERLGLWNPVVAMPDAGGPNWLGRMQFVDTLALTDFHVARSKGSHPINAHYQRYERRVDLYEWHGVGTVDARIFGGEMVRALGWPDPRGRPFGLWVRRELVESGEVDGGARLLGEVAGMAVYLSPRTVPVAVPGGVVRIELLFKMPAAVLPAATRLRVSAGGDVDELPLLTAHPTSIPIQAIPAGRVCRQGALLHVPAHPGPLAVTVEIVPPGQPPVRLEAGQVDVRLPEQIDDAYIQRVVSGVDDVIEAGARLSAISLQATPRQTRAARLALHDQFRKSRDARQFDVASLYDALYADATAVPPPALRKRLAAARARLIERADHQLVTDHAVAERARGAAVALEEAGRFVDGLRRVDLGDIVRAPGARGLLDAARARWLGEPTSADSYPALLGLTLFDQGQVRAQKRLFAARLVVLKLPGN